MKKVLLMIDSLGSGGAQRQLALLARELKKEGYEVVVFIHFKYLHFEYILKDADIELKLIERGGVFDLKFYFKLYKFIKEFKPDVIISYLFAPNIYSRVFGKILNRVKRVYISIRSSDIHHSKKRVLAEKILNRYCDGIIFNSYRGESNYIEHIAPKNSNLKVIYNYIESKDIEREFNSDRLKIGVVNTVARHKAIETILLALNSIESFKKEIELTVVGDIRDKIYHQELLNLTTGDYRVKFSGKVQNVDRFYREFDIFILASTYEGLPNVMLEAMAHRLPLILSDVGDNREFIDGNGAIFKPKDFQALKLEIEKFLNYDRSKLKEMGEISFKILNTLCSRDRFIKSYKEVIES